MSISFNPNREQLNLAQFIARLQALSHDGKNDWMPVSFTIDDEEHPIVNAYIKQDPDFNFDEANCGPDEWIDLDFDDFE